MIDDPYTIKKLTLAELSAQIVSLIGSQQVPFSYAVPGPFSLRQRGAYFLSSANAIIPGVAGEIISAPILVSAPQITGVNEVGEVLTCSDGVWNGSSPIGYSFQWRRNGANISGATNNTYTVVEADSETNITCFVVATNNIGTNDQISNTVTILLYALPINITPPLITVVGSGPYIGQQLTVSNGDWDFQGQTSSPFRYQWRLDGDGLQANSDLLPLYNEDAMSQTFDIASSDNTDIIVGSIITCTVFAENDSGVASELSSNSITIEAAPIVDPEFNPDNFGTTPVMWLNTRELVQNDGDLLSTMPDTYGSPANDFVQASAANQGTYYNQDDSGIKLLNNGPDKFYTNSDKTFLDFAHSNTKGTGTVMVVASDIDNIPDNTSEYFLATSQPITSSKGFLFGASSISGDSRIAFKMVSNTSPGGFVYETDANVHDFAAKIKRDIPNVIVATWDQASLQGYVDGEEFVTQNSSNTFVNGTSANIPRFGGFEAGDFTSAKIFDVVAWEDKLTTEEIKQATIDIMKPFPFKSDLYGDIALNYTLREDDIVVGNDVIDITELVSGDGSKDFFRISGSYGKYTNDLIPGLSSNPNIASFSTYGANIFDFDQFHQGSGCFVFHLRDLQPIPANGAFHLIDTGGYSFNGGSNNGTGMILAITEPNNTLRFYVGDSSANITYDISYELGVLPVGESFTVGVAVDPAQARIFYNGVNVVTQPIGSAYPVSTSSIFPRFFNNGQFHGTFIDAVFYSDQLSNNRMQNLHFGLVKQVVKTPDVYGFPFIHGSGRNNAAAIGGEIFFIEDFTGNNYRSLEQTVLDRRSILRAGSPPLIESSIVDEYRWPSIDQVNQIHRVGGTLVIVFEDLVDMLTARSFNYTTFIKTKFANSTVSGFSIGATDSDAKLVFYLHNENGQAVGFELAGILNNDNLRQVLEIQIDSSEARFYHNGILSHTASKAVADSTGPDLPSHNLRMGDFQGRGMVGNFIEFLIYELKENRNAEDAKALANGVLT